VITRRGPAENCTGVPQLSTVTVAADFCGCCAGDTAAGEHPASPADTVAASARAPTRHSVVRWEDVRGGRDVRRREGRKSMVHLDETLPAALTAHPETAKDRREE
jgi:hypothetical protein